MSSRTRTLRVVACAIILASTAACSSKVSNGIGGAETGRLLGITDAHNRVRSGIQTSPALAPLEWSNELSEYAAAYAANLAENGCSLRHSTSAYGENLFWISGAEATAAQVVESWASEVSDYNYAANTCTPNEQCGHYTQIVWRGTARVGCGYAVCPGDSLREVWSCNYDPPGNYVGQKPY